LIAPSIALIGAICVFPFLLVQSVGDSTLPLDSRGICRSVQCRSLPDPPGYNVGSRFEVSPVQVLFSHFRSSLSIFPITLWDSPRPPLGPIAVIAMLVMGVSSLEASRRIPARIGDLLILFGYCVFFLVVLTMRRSDNVFHDVPFRRTPNPLLLCKDRLVF